MATSLEYFVRHEAARLLRARFSGLFFCLSCLASFRGALGATYTKGQIIEGALQTVSQTPGSLTYKRAFVCGQCGKTLACLGRGAAPVLTAACAWREPETGVSRIQSIRRQTWPERDTTPQ